MSDQMSNQILLVTKNQKLEQLLKDRLEPLGYTFQAALSVEQVLALDPDYKPAAAVIEANSNSEETLDILSTIMAQSPTTRPVVLYTPQSMVDVQEFYEQGAYQILQIPYENDRLFSVIMEAAPIEVPAEKVTLDCLQAVHVVDFKADDPFEFDVFIYLPANQKLFLYRQKGESLSAQQIDKFKKYSFHTLYVRKNEVDKFQAYAAHRLTDAYKDTWLSETERVEKMQKEVRSLLAPLFDSSEFNYAKSRQVLESCKQVVAQFILEVTPHPELFRQIVALSSQSYSNFHHAVNVSTYSALFAMALGYNDIEAATLGGLLHDIGIASLEPEVANLAPELMSQPETESYKRHVTAALDMLQNKKIPAADDVISIIQQHHENVDGTGYPHGLKGEKIHPLAKICALADRFDELTSIRPGMKALSPLAAINSMAADNSLQGVPIRFDNQILTQILQFLQLPTEKQVLGAEPVQKLKTNPVTLTAPPPSAKEDPVSKKDASEQDAEPQQLEALAPQDGDIGLTEEELKLLTKKDDD